MNDYIIWEDDIRFTVTTAENYNARIMDERKCNVFYKRDEWESKYEVARWFKEYLDDDACIVDIDGNRYC